MVERAPISQRGIEGLGPIEFLTGKRVSLIAAIYDLNKTYAILCVMICNNHVVKKGVHYERALRKGL